MDLPAIADFIKSTGFPIFVAIVLLMRVDAMHQANLVAIHELTTEIKLLRTTLDRADGARGPQAQGR